MLFQWMRAHSGKGFVYQDQFGKQSVLAAKGLPMLDSVGGQELEGPVGRIRAQILKVRSVLAQRVEPLFPIARYVYGVRGVGRTECCDEPSLHSTAPGPPPVTQ